MFWQIFISPQVKRSAIISYKHGIYELPQELPNNLSLKKLEKNTDGMDSAGGTVVKDGVSRAGAKKKCVGGVGP